VCLHVISEQVCSHGAAAAAAALRHGRAHLIITNPASAGKDKAVNHWDADESEQP